jgi:hypothetical protein
MAWDTSWTDAGREQFVNDGHAHVREGIRGMAARLLPNVNSDEVTAVILGEVESPHRDALIEMLDAANVKSAQGHSPGITPEERKALKGNSFFPDYLLGPGDQKVYEALRDSNLLNAAIGRRPVKDARDLVGGANYWDEPAAPTALDAAGEPDEEKQRFIDEYRLANAGHDWHTASQMPTRHSTFFGGSPYVQHSTVSEQGRLGNAYERNSDGAIGQALNAFFKWPEASANAARVPKDELHPMAPSSDAVPRAVGSYLWNAPDQFMQSATIEGARNDVNRASPNIPSRVTDPEVRQAHIDNTRWQIEQGGKSPDVKTYGESVGRGYSPVLQWAFDNLHEVADPTTAAGMFAGGLGAGAKAFGSSFGKKSWPRILTALADEVPKAIAREGTQEAASPMTWGVGGAGLLGIDWSKPLTGHTVTPEMKAAAKEKVQEHYDQRQQAVDEIRGVRGY